MKILKSIAKSTFLPFLLFAFVAVMTTTSCQKEETQELTTEDSVDFRATVLQLAYGIPADQIDAPESVAMYHSLMENLTGEQLAEVETLVQNYKAQMNTTLDGENLGFRNSSETILSAGINGDGFGSGIAKSGNTLFVGAASNSKVYVY